LIWLPWTFTFALLTPPPAYLGGWICFFISLMHIAWLTARGGVDVVMSTL
jgi:hypothetical protein